jgi:hypothetical protein
MKKTLIIAVLSSVVSIVTWEALHIVYHIDEPKEIAVKEYIKNK